MVSSSNRRTARLAGILLLAAALAGCSGGPLDPHGPIAAQQRQLIFNALAVMLAIVIPTIAAAVGFAWWFRETNPRAKRRPDFVYSGRVEIVMWSIPVLTVTFLGGLIWTGSYNLDPYRPLPSDRPVTEVQVVALDWKWLFIYPEQGVASVNELVLPAGAPVHFSMTSASVLNTFWIPQLGGMIYVMNGMVTQLNLQADHPGAFYGRSGHFSGDGFSDMRFTARAVPGEEFARWVEAVRGTGAALDRPAYAELTKQNVPDRPFTYRSVAPDLFASVTTQRIPPADGPGSGRGGPGIMEKAER
ncbi:ubiquinol oxidase subunit II [Paracraurococcus lichenis]|uniref:Ubiquinol oxidase subunit 2 n=1 Tax=Paracraurococcus lichenis TaxID=3064888 RepID=A0ABT9DYN2_9PROT|nr:ubiquinol oxidase subunit II [Paracraurococcus sp. LOR1-02]MDO9709016.1 ubiquinol oxidase subunit II [Paracraurococcus sp. LOR1-02]